MRNSADGSSTCFGRSPARDMCFPAPLDLKRQSTRGSSTRRSSSSLHWRSSTSARRSTSFPRNWTPCSCRFSRNGTASAPSAGGRATGLATGAAIRSVSDTAPFDAGCACSAQDACGIRPFHLLGHENGLRTGVTHFLAQVNPTNRLTPHPGPLPFEGRGSATSEPELSNVNSRVRGVHGKSVKGGAAGRAT